jgi:hypothetical protein
VPITATRPFVRQASAPLPWRGIPGSNANGLDLDDDTLNGRAGARFLRATPRPMPRTKGDTMAKDPQTGVPFRPTDLPADPDEAEQARSTKGGARPMPYGIPIDRATYERLKDDPGAPKTDWAQEDEPPDCEDVG